ncbi:peroxiredoxin [Sphingobium sufflavum]|uniref:peroxiredoxin n=1 Tax=Sphingobium sufflavum TaxID=1129547 RepID=UPI001F380D80|nr:peroxiredoxin [Sphingobium sufflavum]MCE7797674.1 peroxiredoxin [Sphingobium sufflavum]
MRTILGLAAMTAAVVLAAAPASASLAVGAKAPDFTTRGAKGGKVFTLHLSDALKKGPVVLYFFPAAFTTGCTAEAREFADQSDAFAKAGATIIGMSNDPVDTLARFSKEECRDKFAVASAGPDIIKGYDVALPPIEGRPMLAGKTNRTSYVIAKSGRIAYVHSDLNYKEHVSGTLAAVQSIAPRK